jgi:plasmid stabilization system protein ParE
MFNTGAIQPGRPSLGSWLMYGLGSESRNLPGFVVLCPGMPVVGSPLWSSAFLPPVFQGTFLKNSVSDPFDLIRNIKPGADADTQRRQLNLLASLNREHLASRAGDSQLEASIEAMETAFRMQAEAPEAFDIRKEKPGTLARYGDSEIGRSCLLARRLAERGVRMVQIYYGNSQPWDSHEDIMVHKRLASRADPAVAALIEDLRDRDMLRDTLVVFGTEFGRTPAVENGSTTKVHFGRDHNSYGYSIALAGGGIRGGMVYGSTDEFGYRAADKPVHPHDVNATLLHLLGLDHARLTYRYSGRDFRLTDVHGAVLREILA